jgi:hypothetical protein
MIQLIVETPELVRNSCFLVLKFLDLLFITLNGFLFGLYFTFNISDGIPVFSQICFLCCQLLFQTVGLSFVIAHFGYLLPQIFFQILKPSLFVPETQLHTVQFLPSLFALTCFVSYCVIGLLQLLVNFPHVIFKLSLLT